MDYPKVCLRRGEEAGVLKGQKLIYDNELDWADDICIDGCVVDVLVQSQNGIPRASNRAWQLPVPLPLPSNADNALPGKQPDAAFRFHCFHRTE